MSKSKVIEIAVFIVILSVVLVGFTRVAYGQDWLTEHGNDSITGTPSMQQIIKNAQNMTHKNVTTDITKLVDKYINQTITDQQQTEAFITELYLKIHDKCVDLPDWLESLSSTEIIKLSKACYEQFAGTKYKIIIPALGPKASFAENKAFMNDMLQKTLGVTIN